MIYLAGNLKPTVQELDALDGRWREHDMYRGCVSHWIANEGGGTKLHDISGRGNHCAPVLTPDLSEMGKYGRAAAFASGDAYVAQAGRVGGTGLFAQTSERFTVSILSSQFVSTGTLISRALTTTQTSRTFQIYYLTSASQVPAIILRGGITDFNTSTNDNNWHRHVITWNGTTGSYYVDGSLLSASLTVGSATEEATSINLAARTNGGANQLNGRLDDIKIFDIDWTADQVQSDFYDPFLPFRWAAEQRPVIYSIPATAGAPAATQYYRRLVGA